MGTARILVLSGSIRSGSHNDQLAGSAVRELSELDCEVTRISLADYPLPIYDGDLEAQDGVPENAIRLARLFHEHDGLFIASPEYNGSLSSLLKNTLDWVSRVSSHKGEPIMPYRGKVAALAAASPGAMGGITMLYHLRDILVRLGTLVVSEQAAIGDAGSAFDDMDRLSNERQAGFLKTTCKSLVEKASMTGRL